ncbi:MAG: hypothetical protein LRZ85_09300 [Alphaproteobacteria bacterium]|nr:hypothetical protein [Alphaproteobacteria bacterium]
MNKYVKPAFVASVMLSAGYAFCESERSFEPVFMEDGYLKHASYSEFLNMREERDIRAAYVRTDGLVHFSLKGDGNVYRTRLLPTDDIKQLFDPKKTFIQIIDTSANHSIREESFYLLAFLGSLSWLLLNMPGYLKKEPPFKRSEADIRRTTYHEAGHALLSVLYPGRFAPEYVTIQPAYRSAGHLLGRPRNRKHFDRKDYLHDIIITMGGAAAEQVVYGMHADGCPRDLEMASVWARHMVSKIGMSQKLGMVSYPTENIGLLDRLSGGERVSDETLREIELEARSIANEAMAIAVKTITENRAALEALTEVLLQKKTLQAKEIMEIVNIYKADAPPQFPLEKDGISRNVETASLIPEGVSNDNIHAPGLS